MQAGGGSSPPRPGAETLSGEAPRRIPSLFATTIAGLTGEVSSTLINRSTGITEEVSRINASQTKDEPVPTSIPFHSGRDSSTVGGGDLDRNMYGSGGISSHHASPDKMLSTAAAAARIEASPPSGGRGGAAHAEGAGGHGSGRPIGALPRMGVVAAPSGPGRIMSASAGRAAACPSPSSTLDYADIEQKQSELRRAVEYRVASLERALLEREGELAELQGRLRKMEEDYQFNYNLIAERDAALEEASVQLQRLYRELRHVTGEGSAMEKKMAAATSEVAALRQRVREVEEDREAAVLRIRKEVAIKEKHLAETTKAREAELEADRQRLHEEYLSKTRALEQGQADMEGKSAALTADLEERLRAQSRCTQGELAAAQKESEACKRRARQLEEEVAALQLKHNAVCGERDSLEQRYRAASEEAEQSRQALEGKLVQTNAQLGKSIAAVEETIREEASKSARLEMERAALQRQLSDAVEQLQHTRTQRDEDAARYSSECEELRANYSAAKRAMSELERKWRETEQQQQHLITTKTSAAEHLEWDLRQAREELIAARQQLSRLQSESSKWQAEATHHSAEAQRWKEEESRTADRARKDAVAAEERRLALERALQEVQADAEVQKRKLFDVQERAQADGARLARELHSSEAARRALEEQYHLVSDEHGQGALLHSLRMDKEALERRVVELERTNGEIRAQVANFTLELQNDPLVRGAKETQRRVQGLQEELLAARAEAQRLRDSLAEREEEVSRCQAELAVRRRMLPQLEAAGHVGGSGIRGGGDGTAMFGSLTAGLQEQQNQLREEYAELRRSYEDVGRQLDKERRRRRNQRGARSRSSSSAHKTAKRSNKRGGSPTDSASDRDSRHPSRHSRGCSSRRARKGVAGTPSAPTPPPALPRCMEAVNEDKQHLAQESRVWRQKCLELEQHLRVLLRERDQLSRQFQLAQQDIRSLSSEKQSLLDLNSLLKTQLREAYRTAFDSSTRTVPPLPPPPPAPAASPPNNDSAPPPSSEAVTATLEHAPHTEKLAASNGHRHRGSSGGGGGLAVDRVRVGGFAAASGTATGRESCRHSTSALHQRLTRLDEELHEVREQIATTMANHSSSSGVAPVVRRGTTTVRHYGFQ